MKKELFYFLGFIVISLIAGCKSEMIQPDSSSTISSARTGSTTAVLYVNDFSDILGNTSKEDSLLNWCTAQGFNQVNLYNISTILSSSTTKNQLNSFVAKAHGNPYYFRVAFVASGSTTVTNINNYCQNYTNIPEAVISEYEFWNSGNSYASFASLLNAMNTLRSNNPSVEREIYVSQFSDAAGVTNSDTICRNIIINSETVFLVNYSNNAYNLSTTLTNKLQKLADNASALSKVADIVVIFKVNTASSDPNIYNYFSTAGLNHPFEDAYTNLMTGYTSSSITNKANLNNTGYAIYRYSNAVSARP